MRSQHGPLASAPYTTLPTSRHARIDSQSFRFLLCRRLRLPIPLCSRTCRCGRPLDILGHHLAACAEAGVLEKRGSCWSVQQPKSVGRQGLGCPLTCLFATSTWRSTTGLNGRRLEVVANGLTLWQGAQLAIDTTMVSPMRRDGTALKEARRRKERTYPELAGEKARLVVLGAGVGGRWSAETAQLLSALAKARAREVPFILQARAEAAWRRRWSNILACSAARAFRLFLVGDPPSTSHWGHAFGE